MQDARAGGGGRRAIPLTQPTVTDLGIRLTAPDEFTKRPKHSAFFITINTNKGETVCDVQSLAREFHALLIKIFGKHEELANIIKILTPGDDYFSKVQHVESEVVVEKGQHPKGGRVHAHILLQMKHFTMVHVDKYALEDRIVTSIGTCPLTSVYINIKSVGYAANLRGYFTKYVREADS